MTTNFDPHVYGKLLAEYLPGVIDTEAENDRALKLILTLMKKGRNRPFTRRNAASRTACRVGRGF